MNTEQLKKKVETATTIILKALTEINRTAKGLDYIDRLKITGFTDEITNTLIILSDDSTELS